MDPLTMMFLSTILSSMISSATSKMQQDYEFGQQKELLGAEQDFVREREDLAYQRQKPQQYYADLLSTGMNPNIAAQALAGGNSESASLGGSPSAPSVNSAIEALQRTMSDNGQNVYDLMMRDAQIKQIEANTNKTQVETGILPRDYQLRKMSVAGQLRVWDKSVEKMASEIGLNDEQKKLVEQQHLYYGRLSDAQIQAYQTQAFKNLSDAALSLQKIKESEKSMDVMDADILLKNAEKSNVEQNTRLQSEETGLTYYKAERERIAKEFEQKMAGVPLTADAQRYVHSLLIDGKVDEARKFYEGIFQSAMHQEIGNSVGSYAYLGKWREKHNPIFQISKGGLIELQNPYDLSPVWNP